MRTRYSLALLLLLAPGAARAEEATEPEGLLPAGAQLYLRWDGIPAHRADYEKTALGKMMRGDTGTFVRSAFEKLRDSVGTLLTVDQLLSGVPPEQLQKLQADAGLAAELPALIGRHGLVLAAEVRTLDPPRGQLTLVLPGAGAKPDPLFAALRLAAGLARQEVRTRKIQGRAVSSLALPPVHLAWWVEGKHAVVQLSTDKPEEMVKAMAGKGARLPSAALAKRVAGFKTFRTSARAFVDVSALVKLARTRGKEVNRLLDDLGVGGLRSVVFYSGFAGPAERALVEVDMPGPRKGLLALFKGKPFKLGDVPALPPDVVSWSMTNVDVGDLYDVALRAVEGVLRITSPEQAGQVRAFPKLANDALGIDLRKDLLGSLGDRLVMYNTPSEGPLTLGQTVLLKVKDEEKLLESVEQAIKGLAKLAGADVRLRKRTYRGVVLREVIVRQQGFFFRPTYGVHEGWLAVSLFPQPVQGYVARAKGAMRAWKPSPGVQGSLKALPGEFVSISYSDPRPGLKQLFALAPVIGGLVDSLVQDFNFDVASLPNAQEATRHLFPNVSVTTDDGKTLRVETRASLALPFDLSGIDTYGFFLLSFARIG